MKIIKADDKKGVQVIKESRSFIYRFHAGALYNAYAYFGAHVKEKQGRYTYLFRTFAPHADAVFVVGDFCGWERGIPMRRINEGGIFEARFSSDRSYLGAAYKFRIVSNAGAHDKGDPYAFASKGGADGASILTERSRFFWGDEGWMKTRRRLYKEGRLLSSPLNIYEVHLASFMRGASGGYLSYGELAKELLAYVKYMGYTHIELLPIAEYPFDDSWGYQVGAFYAPTARFGSPDGLRAFVSYMHEGGVGVILDWVGAHFPKDEWGLYEFDGGPLYEYSSPYRIESPSWGTRYFDLGREEVQSFLISNALYWLREFHFDGLRVDAVSSMLYLDYDRAEGEWEPNCLGTNRNLEAEAFLKKLNRAVHRFFPDCLTVAEESTSYPGVTSPPEEGGLGFDLKWNMGFANDLYRYLASSPSEKKGLHTALNFPITYAFGERYVLPISHDEVVHGKGSFLGKMYGAYEEKFALARCALLFYMTFPGKKLLFMGSEYGQFAEWDFRQSLEWFMLEYEKHGALREYTAALNRFYLSSPALYEIDFCEEGFRWVYADESEGGYVGYRRFSKGGEELFVLIGFSDRENRGITVSLPEGGSYQSVFSTLETGEIPHRIEGERLIVDLPPLAGAIFKRIEKEGAISPQQIL